jgi:CRISPR-associated endonuclease/helicase Cas3
VVTPQPLRVFIPVATSIFSAAGAEFLMPSFKTFFAGATGNAPYDYQARLACGEHGRTAGGDDGVRCESQLISIPTGLGKTAAVVLAWLWNRVHLNRTDWPRRLVICLPMRTLVEQTEGSTRDWLNNLGLLWDGKNDHAGKVGLHVLMGGTETAEWDIHPEADAILIGTQDMLLSRALNRGYGMARARWPMHFGLLNNDALWVLDETQLMGVGVRTSAQLEGLRAKFGTAVGCATWWASATLDPRLLDTPDHSTLPATLALGPADLAATEVLQRVNATKRLSRLPPTLTADSAKAVDPYIEKLASTVIEKHRPGSTTIVILNRVNRARDLFEILGKAAKKRALPECLLVHSRFRPLEREPLSAAIKAPGEKIIVATQAIEAGVDISARTLITELAPWSSLVQRFGRCNRKGEFNADGGADTFWLDLAAEDEKSATDLALPYTPEQLATARALLQSAEPAGTSPAALEKIHCEEPLAESHILRRKDLVELFDTTPDLAGLDIDVGRYIRDGDERDVQVFWRELSKEPSDEALDAIVPQRAELVRVALHEFRKFFDRNKAERRIWHWSALDGQWQVTRADRISPGQVFLVDQALGGYASTLGWTGDKKEPFRTLRLDEQAPRRSPRDGQGTDDESQRPENNAAAWQSIEQHTAHVVDACQELIAALPAALPWADSLRTAALWHDVGKSHACFQTFITAGRSVPPEFAQSFIAKSPWKAGSKHGRPHFRHELASALAWLQAGGCADPFAQNLVAYLIATHHGKIRLSIRAMPGEKAPAAPADGSSPLFARGIWPGDRLPGDATKRLTLERVLAEPITLDLSCMQTGDQNGLPSWTSRMLSLRDSSQLGLFRLAWLETLLRAADAEGSQR